MMPLKFQLEIDKKRNKLCQNVNPQEPETYYKDSCISVNIPNLVE
jgi:hypothetical protein